jgi:hypothetical protein
MSVDTPYPSEALRIDAEMARVWEAIPVGEPCPSARYVAGAGLVASYKEAVDLTGLGVHPKAEGTIPNDFFCGDYGVLTMDFGQSIGFHASHRFRSHGQARIGDTVDVTGVVVDKFKKRGFRYFTLAFEEADEQGNTFCVQETTIAVGVLRDPAYVPEKREGTAAPKDELDWQVLATARISQDAMNEYAALSAARLARVPEGGNAHVDDAFAQSAGLAGTNAQSLHYVGWLSRLLTEEWGAPWLQSGALECKFVGQVGADTELCLELAGSDAPGPTAFRILDGAGRPVCLGTASVEGEPA